MYVDPSIHDQPAFADAEKQPYCSTTLYDGCFPVPSSWIAGTIVNPGNPLCATSARGSDEYVIGPVLNRSDWLKWVRREERRTTVSSLFIMINLVIQTFSSSPPSLFVCLLRFDRSPFAAVTLQDAPFILVFIPFRPVTRSTHSKRFAPSKCKH